MVRFYRRRLVRHVGVRRPSTAALVMVAVVVLVGACSNPPSPSSPTASAAATTAGAGVMSADLQRQIDDIVNAEISTGTGKGPGFVVSVGDPVHGTYAKAYGISNISTNAPIAVDDYYRIASVTKTFTGTAILKLVAAGKMALTDPISTYVDGVPGGDKVTIRNLLAMRSGLPDFTADKAFLAAYTADPLYPSWKTSDVITIMQQHASEAIPPDTKTVYTDSNYVLLQLAVEKVSGQRFCQVITSEVIQPLGLTHTVCPDGPDLPSPYAVGYDIPPGATSLRDFTRSNPAVAGGAGNIISTVPDMARYAGLLASGAGLPADLQAQRLQTTPLSTSGVPVSYGLGIGTFGKWVGHTGGIFGYGTIVLYLPDSKATVVVMQNHSSLFQNDASEVWAKIAKLMYPSSLGS